MNTSDSPSSALDPERREFLQKTTGGLTAGLAVLSSAWSTGVGDKKNAELLPTIQLGPHAVTRLIIGGNPIYGHSHFNKLLGQHQVAWHTPERVVELLQRCQNAGINTWQNSFDKRPLADLDRFRAVGGKMHWLCLGKPDWDKHPELIHDAAKRHPIGIAPHGHLAERLHRESRLPVLLDLLKRIRDEGVLV